MPILPHRPHQRLPYRMFPEPYLLSRLPGYSCEGWVESSPHVSNTSPTAAPAVPSHARPSALSPPLSAYPWPFAAFAPSPPPASVAGPLQPPPPLRQRPFLRNESVHQLAIQRLCRLPQRLQPDHPSHFRAFPSEYFVRFHSDPPCRLYRRNPHQHPHRPQPSTHVLCRPRAT